MGHSNRDDGDDAGECLPYQGRWWGNGKEGVELASWGVDLKM